MSPAHPSVKCFFLRLETIVRRAAVYLRPTLVSAISAVVPVEKKLLKTVVKETYEA
jgi:hypothetical protein